MRNAKRIGLTMRVMRSEFGEARDAIAQTWAGFLMNEVGVVPICIPNLGASVIRFVEAVGIDGLMITGGENPGTVPERDETEWALLKHSLSHGIPVIGVCRGMQVIQQYFGGTLTRCDRASHVAQTHEVEFVNGRFGAATRRTVNSFHEMGIAPETLAQSLRAFAVSPDGFIEGLFHPEQPVSGFMWHPERSGSSAAADATLIRQSLGIAP